MLTGQYDVSRTGANLKEATLRVSNVNAAQFGKLFTRLVDGQIYAQPLYVANLRIPGQGVHNVLFVATMNNSIYAFDADDPALSGPLWHVNLGPAIPITGVINGSIGILSTPVIDLESQTLFAAAQTLVNQTQTLRLHALDLSTGLEKNNGPVTVAASVPGKGYDNRNGIVTLSFANTRQIQRPALLLANGLVYLGLGSYGDIDYYHGWLLAYFAANLAFPPAVFNATPNGGEGAIWQSGGGPAADDAGNVYVISGNGSFDRTADFGESFIKLSGGGLHLLDFFTPNDWASLNPSDLDFGNSGPMLIPGTNLAVGADKQGQVYAVDRNHMGGLETSIASAQIFTASTGGINGQAFWNRSPNPLLYVWGWNDVLKSYALANGRFESAPVSQGSYTANFPGGMMTVSADGSTVGTGIVWALTSPQDALRVSVPGTLRAFDAGNLSHELWDSDQNQARDQLGSLSKFTAPTVVNGKVYAATFSNQVAVYGLLCGSDVTDAVRVASRAFQFEPGQQVQQSVTITNTASQAIAGPLFLVLDSLSHGAVLKNAAGATSCAAPAGSPYVAVPLPGPWLEPGSSATLTLVFTDPANAAIGYKVRVLAGGIQR